MMITIYKITNSFNDKVYIGQTTKSMTQRFNEHLSRRTHCVKLMRALDKYDRDNFKVEFIMFTHTQEIADHWEKYWIDKYNSISHGYNIRGGGSRGKISEETKKKLSAIHLGKPKSLEHIAKMRKSKLGSKYSLEARKNMSEARKGNTNRLGQKVSEETKMKMSESAKGKNIWTKGMTWKNINGKRVWSKNDK